MRGDERQQIAEKLVHQRPASVATDMTLQASKKVIQKGNDTGCPSNHAVRQIGYEVTCTCKIKRKD